VKKELYVIGRIVLQSPAFSIKYRLAPLWNTIGKLAEQMHSNIHVEFLITPGRFLRFPWPEELDKPLSLSGDLSAARNVLLRWGKGVSEAFMDKIPRQSFRKLRDCVDYLTIGIDSQSSKQGFNVELVTVYDMQAGKVIHVTGKSQPTKGQEKTLIPIADLGSHFIHLNKHKVIVLGCHDLNLYSPRALANTKGWRQMNIREFARLTKKFKPDVILQHPHTTDTYKIWNTSWAYVEKHYPSVLHYASGVRYWNWSGLKPRASLSDVLQKTKKGDVIDFVF
jgi:hypothetical protein